MTRSKNLLLTGLFAAFLSLTGCCCGGGGSEEQTTANEKPAIQGTTLGDELMKLQEARDKGAISAEEYEAAKAKLLQGK